MTKYKQYFQLMLEQNKELFETFKKLHDDYMKDPTSWQAQFNEEGKQVVEVIRDYERRLCSHSEKGQYSKFSSRLTDKFWDEVRAYLPKIDFVGIQ